MVNMGPLCAGEAAPILNYGTTMRTRADETQSVVRWTFHRGNELLTCQVHRQRSGLYRLSLIPHAPKGLSAVETFGHLVSALHRHAAIAKELRQQGWVVVSYGTTPQTPTYRTAWDSAAA
jgi:hypothetical protein